MKPVRYIVLDIETKYLKETRKVMKNGNIDATVQLEIADRSRKLRTFAPHLKEEQATMRVQLLSPYYSEVLSATYLMLDEKFEPIYPIFYKFCDTYYQEDDLVSTLLREFEEMEERYTITYVGFNIINFDAYYLFIKALLNEIESKKTRIGLFNFQRYRTHPVFDISQWLANWQRSNLISLQTAARSFGIKTPTKNSMKDSDGNFLLQECYLNGEYKAIQKYSEEDVEVTAKLFKAVAPYYL